MKKDKVINNIAKLIRKEVAYFNGWDVSVETMEKDCEEAAKNILTHLGRGHHLTSRFTRTAKVG
jgi:hypothetical protein